MGDSQIKDELLQQAYSITLKSIKRIGLSYATFLQECGEFILWAQHDKDLLRTAGLNISTLSEAEILLEEARNIHVLWMNESKLTKDEIANWNQKRIQKESYWEGNSFATSNLLSGTMRICWH